MGASDKLLQKKHAKHIQSTEANKYSFCTIGPHIKDDGAGPPAF